MACALSFTTIGHIENAANDNRFSWNHVHTEAY